MLKIRTKTGLIGVSLGGLAEESPSLLVGLPSNLGRWLWEERESRAATGTGEAGAGCQDVAILTAE